MYVPQGSLLSMIPHKVSEAVIEGLGIRDPQAHSSVGPANTATRLKNRLASNDLQEFKCSTVRDINSVLADSQQQGSFP